MSSIEAPVAATVQTPSAIHASFTLNLIRFVSWPREALGPTGAPFVIGTFADDPVNPYLDAAVRNETYGSHQVRTVRIKSVEEMKDCHVVFISRGAADLGIVLARVARRPILTVSDADDFIAKGGHVQFSRRPPYTRFQVSADNLAACDLAARGQLLRIAARP